MSSIHTVRGSQLQIGDVLASEEFKGVEVVDVYYDWEGLWVEWSTGDGGYLSESQLFDIYAE